MSDVVILGSENPAADVLVYDDAKKYNEGVLIDDSGDTLTVEVNGVEVDLEYEYVSEA